MSEATQKQGDGTGTTGPLRKRIKTDANDGVKDPTVITTEQIVGMPQTAIKPEELAKIGEVSAATATKLYSTQMIGGMPKPVSTKSREARLEQNRKAARESRKRKKVMVEELQRSVIFFSRNNHILREHNENLSRLLVQAQNFVQMSMQQQAQNQQNGAVATGTTTDQTQPVKQEDAEAVQTQTTTETPQETENFQNSTLLQPAAPQEENNQPQAEETVPQEVPQAQPQVTPAQPTAEEQQAAANRTSAAQAFTPNLATMFGNTAQTAAAATPVAPTTPGAAANNNATLQAAAANFQAAMAASNGNFAALGYPTFGGAAPYADAFQSAFLQQQAAAAAASGQTPNFSGLGVPGFTAPFQHPALAQFSQNVTGLQFPNTASPGATAGIFPSVAAQIPQQNDRTGQPSVRS